MSRCVNHGQRLAIRQYWPPSSPTGIRGFLGCSRRSTRPSGGVCTTAIRYRAGQMVGLALLGDAAHAMLPRMGQGANQAIADGMALATMLRGTDAAEATEATEALIRYQGLRHDHTARVQQGSRANGMRMDAGQAITIGQPGVHDYDVEAEARVRR
jgi:2-polyprenyl-6-methoxyphenol hydroxylase-like FAD-dependent oxidoreductase